MKSVIVIIPLLVLVSCGQNRRDDKPPHIITLRPVNFGDAKISNGLYYILTRTSDELHIHLVNCLGPNVFVRTGDLCISSYSIASADIDGLATAGGGGKTYTIKGPETFTRLAYDFHKDGSICGWQLTLSGKLDIRSAVEDATIRFEISAQAFMPDKSGRYQMHSIKIAHSGTLADIVKQSVRQGDAPEPATGADPASRLPSAPAR